MVGLAELSQEEYAIVWGYIAAIRAKLNILDQSIQDLSHAFHPTPTTPIEPESESELESKPEPEPELEPDPEPVLTPALEPEPKLDPEPKPEPKPDPEFEPEPEPELEPEPEPEPVLTPELEPKLYQELQSDSAFASDSLPTSCTVQATSPSLLPSSRFSSEDFDPFLSKLLPTNSPKVLIEAFCQINLHTLLLLFIHQVVNISKTGRMMETMMARTNRDLLGFAFDSFD